MLGWQRLRGFQGNWQWLKSSSKKLTNMTDSSQGPQWVSQCKTHFLRLLLSLNLITKYFVVCFTNWLKCLCQVQKKKYTVWQGVKKNTTITAYNIQIFVMSQIYLQYNPMFWYTMAPITFFFLDQSFTSAFIYTYIPYCKSKMILYKSTWSHFYFIPNPVGSQCSMNFWAVWQMWIWCIVQG